MSEVALIVFVIVSSVLVYTLLAYPALENLLRLIGGNRVVVEPETLPSVTLIIAAFNEEAVLAEKLTNCLTLDYPPDRFEIILASDGSIDSTVDIARQFESQGVRVLEFEKNRGKASVVSDAAALAVGDVICLSDANVMFHENALKKLVAHLGNERTGAVSGDVRLASHESTFGHGESAYYRLERLVQLGESHLGSMIGVDGGMYVIRRKLFQPLPMDTILDDFVITMNVIRQGYRVVYEPTAIATENGTPSARDEFYRRIRVAAGAMQSIKRRQWPPLRRPIELWQYVSHKLLRWLGPVWLVLLLVSNIALLNEEIVFQASLVLQIVFYLVAGLAAICVPLQKTPFGGIPFYFAMSHVAMGIGLVKGLLWTQQGMWERTVRSRDSSKGSDSSTDSERSGTAVST